MNGRTFPRPRPAPPFQRSPAPRVLIDWGSLALRQQMFETGARHGASGMGARMSVIPRLVDTLLPEALDEDAPYSS